MQVKWRGRMRGTDSLRLDLLPAADTRPRVSRVVPGRLIVLSATAAGGVLVVKMAMMMRT